MGPGLTLLWGAAGLGRRGVLPGVRCYHASMGSPTSTSGPGDATAWLPHRKSWLQALICFSSVLQDASRGSPPRAQASSRRRTSPHITYPDHNEVSDLVKQAKVAPPAAARGRPLRPSMPRRPPPQLYKHIDLDHDLHRRELPHLGQLLEPLARPRGVPRVDVLQQPRRLRPERVVVHF